MPRFTVRLLIYYLALLFAAALASADDRLLADAFSQQKSDVQVEGSGHVIRLLSDDNEGRRHQRFLVQLASGQTLLVAHNIDLAPKVVSLKLQDLIRFYGEYEWNSKGGAIHWTHRDPKNRHAHGWLEHQGVLYQ